MLLSESTGTLFVLFSFQRSYIKNSDFYIIKSYFMVVNTFFILIADFSDYSSFNRF